MRASPRSEGSHDSGGEEGLRVDGLGYPYIYKHVQNRLVVAYGDSDLLPREFGDVGDSRIFVESSDDEKSLGLLFGKGEGFQTGERTRKTNEGEGGRVRTVKNRGFEVGKSWTNHGAMHPTTVVRSPSMMNWSGKRRSSQKSRSEREDWSLRETRPRLEV